MKSEAFNITYEEYYKRKKELKNQALAQMYGYKKYLYPTIKVPNPPVPVQQEGNPCADLYNYTQLKNELLERLLQPYSYTKPKNDYEILKRMKEHSELSIHTT